MARARAAAVVTGSEGMARLRELRARKAAELAELAEAGRAEWRTSATSAASARFDYEAFEQRAAILEFDAGFSRAEAERRAAAEYGLAHDATVRRGMGS